MKKFLLFLALSLSALSQAQVRMEEELYLPNQSPEVVRELIETGSVVVDHVTSHGFELYGAKGLSRYLDQKNILYFNMQELNQKMLSSYPSYEEITEKLKAAVAKRPDIMQMFSVGKSIQGRDLWMVKISDNVAIDEVEPEFKYISSMHGDEITGRELMVSFIEEIAEKYGKDSEITELVNNTEIFIMPSMNPDGSELRRRGNARFVDLNRDFPDITRDRESRPTGRQVETQHVMKFQEGRNFALSANFHGGTIVMNYPWDSKYERHPLDSLAKELALIYSELNPEMISSDEFPSGITNGADWYVVKGGMQDWSYFWHNDLQLTVELSHQKWPPYSQIPGFYKDNRDSIVAYLKQIHRGAGFKLSASDKEGSVAVKQLAPVQRELGSFAFKNSEFYKVLPEGEYEFVVTEKNRAPRTLKLQVDRNVVRPNGNYVLLR